MAKQRGDAMEGPRSDRFPGGADFSEARAVVSPFPRELARPESGEVPSHGSPKEEEHAQEGVHAEEESTGSEEEGAGAQEEGGDSKEEGAGPKEGGQEGARPKEGSGAEEAGRAQEECKGGDGAEAEVWHPEEVSHPEADPPWIREEPFRFGLGREHQLQRHSCCDEGRDPEALDLIRGDGEIP
jgi:hypothetical protein